MVQSKRVKRVGPDRNFGKLYHAVVDRVWGYLSPTAQAIYPVLLRFADYHHRCTGVAQSYIGRVARPLRPIPQERVSRAISELERWGIVERRWTARGLTYYLPRDGEIVEHLTGMVVLPPAISGKREATPPPESEAKAEGPDWDSLPATFEEVQQQERASRARGDIWP